MTGLPGNRAIAAMRHEEQRQQPGAVRHDLARAETNVATARRNRVRIDGGLPAAEALVKKVKARLAESEWRPLSKADRDRLESLARDFDGDI